MAGRSAKSDQVAVITGASSGIGEATARMLAADGARLVLGARRGSRLEALAARIVAEGGEAAWAVADVTRRDDHERLADLAESRFGALDVWINNAGVAPLAPLDALRVDEWEQMVDVNLKGVLFGTAAALRRMNASGRGHVINVGSVASHLVYPNAAVYCATKFAVKAFTEGLRLESNGRVRATLISPGAVTTELLGRVSHQATRAEMAPSFEQALDPQAVARAVIWAIAQPADVDVNEVIVRPFRAPR